MRGDLSIQGSQSDTDFETVYFASSQETPSRVLIFSLGSLIMKVQGFCDIPAK
jgi:hypothetical protein